MLGNRAPEEPCLPKQWKRLSGAISERNNGQMTRRSFASGDEQSPATKWRTWQFMECDCSDGQFLKTRREDEDERLAPILILRKP